MIAAVGVIDDVLDLPALREAGGAVRRRHDPGLQRRLGEYLTLPFVGGFELGWVAHPLTVLGIVAVINVINFIDGVDGLAAGVCVIAAITFAVIALSLDRNAAGVLAALHRRRRRSASSGTASRPPRASWATPAPTCSATCWRRSPSRAR